MHFTYPNSDGIPLQEFNTCHEPSGSTQQKPGTFARKGSSGCAPSTGTDTSHQLPAHESSLLSGSITSSDSENSGGANVAMVVEVTGEDGESSKAVYKPEVGECWRGAFCNGDINRFLNNKEFSLAEREVAAHDVDQVLGLDVVPETVLREQVDVEVNVEDSDDEGGGYDEDEAREQYDQWRQNEIDSGRVYDAVGDAMGELESAARDEHVADVESRAEEVNAIWNELVDAHPDGDDMPDYGLDVDKQPLLLNDDYSKQGAMFDAAEVSHRGGKVLDPLDVLEQAQVDVSSKMNREERENVRAILAKAMLEDGYDEMGDVDTEVAREGFDRDKWIDDHAETENRLMDENIASFGQWKRDNGYNSGDGGGGGKRNDDAPHPNGGSLQRFVGDSTWGAPNNEQKIRVAVLDYVLGSMDRHPGNLLVSEAGARAHAIDNGYSFPDGNAQLRSFVVDNLPATVPAALRKTLHDNIKAANWAPFYAKHPAMDTDERKWFESRVARMEIALQTEEGLLALWRQTKRKQ